jgi:hypothetical protein
LRDAMRSPAGPSPSDTIANGPKTRKEIRANSSISQSTKKPATRESVGAVKRTIIPPKYDTTTVGQGTNFRHRPTLDQSPEATGEGAQQPSAHISARTGPAGSFAAMRVGIRACNRWTSLLRCAHWSHCYFDRGAGVVAISLLLGDGDAETDYVRRSYQND